MVSQSFCKAHLFCWIESFGIKDRKRITRAGFMFSRFQEFQPYMIIVTFSANIVRGSKIYGANLFFLRKNYFSCGAASLHITRNFSALFFYSLYFYSLYILYAHMLSQGRHRNKKTFELPNPPQLYPLCPAVMTFYGTLTQRSVQKLQRLFSVRLTERVEPPPLTFCQLNFFF